VRLTAAETKKNDAKQFKGVGSGPWFRTARFDRGFGSGGGAVYETVYRLIGIRVSPSTEKSVWTMDHAAQPYVFEEYLPQVSTPWVRLRTGNYTGLLTVPILIGPQRLRLFDSFDIVRHMAEVAPESGLVPADRREDM
jgi:hypothetical protein